MTNHKLQRLVLGTMLFCVAMSSALACQSREYAAIKWWHPVVASLGVAALVVVDQPIHDFWQDNRSGTLDDISDVAKQFKEPEVFIAAGSGAMALGLMLDEPVVAQTGLQIVAAYGLSSGMMIATKWLFGRSRPSDTPDDHIQFDWFDGDENSSFPSGSAAVVFSLATTVADAADNNVVSVALYGGAVLNSWSRVYGNRHWFTDVLTGSVLGSLIGVSLAKWHNDLAKEKYYYGPPQPPATVISLSFSL